MEQQFLLPENPDGTHGVSFSTRGCAWKVFFDGVAGDWGVQLGEICHP